jgi:Tfp pilus assembly protein PilF
MKHILLILLLLTITGCATGSDQRMGKSNPGAYHYQMGLGYLGERNFTGALVELTEAEKYDPENAELLYNLGLAYIGKKRPDLAEQRFQHALILKPNYTTARNDLGIAYLELKRWDSAIQQFKIVKDDLFYENNESAIINLGLAYLGKGDYPKALEELRSVLAVNPRRLEARLSLGRVYFAMDKTEQAIAEFKKALEIYKDYGDAHYYLGLAYLKLNNADAAKASFKEAVRVIPETERGRSAQGYLELLK